MVSGDQGTSARSSGGKRSRRARMLSARRTYSLSRMKGRNRSMSRLASLVTRFSAVGKQHARADVVGQLGGEDLFQDARAQGFVVDGKHDLDPAHEIGGYLGFVT